jgi:Zn-dependent protease
VPSNLELSLVAFAIFIGSIILHEVAHGLSALALGDDTAKRSGRLTLNPIPHLDPVGSVALPALLLLSHTGFVFGWAKPVPVNVSRLRHPRNDAVWTSLAGPATNGVLVVLAVVALKVWHPTDLQDFDLSGNAVTFPWAFFVLIQLALVNLRLGIFNLLPIPPLDGSAVVERVIPNRWYGPYLAIRPYTMLLVIGFVFLAQVTGWFTTSYTWMYNHLLTVTGYG